jgi:protein-tyrosine-phosphatase/8-oxo-dGTP pyrophosphatase MutT (NUDIX family)
MKDKIKIHFVCRGNVYRSRLAEAYAKSEFGVGYEITSSGIYAIKYPHIYVSPWTKILSHEYGLTQYLSEHTTQTNNHILENQDILIFMSEDVYKDAVSKYIFNNSKSVVWKVKDREDWAKKISLHDKRQKTYKKISRQANELIKDIKQGGWVDVVDGENKPLGFSLPINIANKNSVWHRGCHAIITTPNKKTLVQKRSNNIIFSPKLVDISLGGHVDVNEQPCDAIVREIKEEVGLDVGAEDLIDLGIYKQSNYHPKYKKHNRSFIYTYHVRLNEDKPNLTIQKEEVDSVKLLTPSQLKRLIKYSRLKHVGRLNYPHVYYKNIAKLSEVI